MKTDLLDELLSRVDAAAPPPLAGGGDLAAQVRRRARGRRNARRLGTLAVAGCLCVVLVMVVMRTDLKTPSPVAQGIDVGRVRLELARLDSEAQTHLMTARAVERAEIAVRRRAEDERVAVESTDDRLETQRERAAAILIREADWMANVPEQRAMAEGAYRRVVQLFSETSAGSEARRRLESGV